MMIANGGTQIESFLSPEALRTIPQDQWKVKPMTAEILAELKPPAMPKLPEGVEAPSPAYAEVLSRALDREAAKGFPGGKTFQFPNIVHNSLMAPVFPMAVRGVLWYQGEHNSGDVNYDAKLKAMITDWRARLGQEDLPFIITQLCNWNLPKDGGFHVTREEQLHVSQTVPNTALVVTIDLANKEGDDFGSAQIHPKNKTDVGHRNALAARALVYGEKIVSSGPIYKAMKVENGKIRLTFDSVGSGLEAKGEKLVGFHIAGEDQKFVPAAATIEGRTVVVSAPQVASPVAVRYGFAQFVHPLCNLYNKEGLPASPFRTDNWSWK